MYMQLDPLKSVQHRPWPLPARRWTMRQTWHDLLFAHWPVDADQLLGYIPPGLELDTFDGTAWLGVVPFRMSGVRPRNLPAVPWLSAFPELNLRTYVKRRPPAPPQPGVVFYSLDAANPLAVSIARRFYHLPYYRASMQLVDDGNTIRYRSQRTHSGASPAAFVADYAPTGGIYTASSDTLDQWLTERYCLYTTDARGRLNQAQIHHIPWPLQTAECELYENTVAAAAGLALPNVPPLLHFARRLDVLIWPLQPVTA
jgi:uncharacterized protein YqjF (DUF2071 family)